MLRTAHRPGKAGLATVVVRGGRGRHNYELCDEEALGPFPHDWQAREGRVVLTGEYGGIGSGTSWTVWASMWNPARRT